MESNYTFLVIEDNVIDQIITRQILKRTFIASEIYVVDDGKEGIRWLKNYKSKLNHSLIILSDIDMPVMNGFQFISKYNKLSDGLKKETQLFMLSSTLCISEINKCRSNPFVEDVLSKPLPIERFLDIIRPLQKCPA
ncbi:MAG: response regulator [Bacteroidota bacterium]